MQSLNDSRNDSSPEKQPPSDSSSALTPKATPREDEWIELINENAERLDEEIRSLIEKNPIFSVTTAMGIGLLGSWLVEIWNAQNHAKGV